jgi:DNA-binding SARP family transcriptional activator
MQINMLGPFEVRQKGKPITPTAAKPRQVLALLAMRAGQQVRVRTLTEELWGETLPDSSTQTLQTYILHLRRRIAGATTPDAASGSELAKKVLAFKHGGYLLDVAAEDIDVHRFEQLAAAGDNAMARQDYESAARLLAAALDVWRGPTLVDVQAGNPLLAHVNRLEESRLGVLESRIDADLRLGRHHMLLGELAELTSRFPMHEQLWSQYMLAQYRSGRQWRALEIFQKLRHTLIAELGLEPSSRAQRLLQAILNSDPALDTPYLGQDLAVAVG